MLKDKRSLYILLPLVGLLWGFIIYRIVAFTDQEERVSPIEITEISRPLDQEKSDWSLELDYPDPFLKKVPRAVTRTGNIDPEEEPNPVGVIRPETRAAGFEGIKAQLVYHGYITRGDRGNRVALLQVNGHDLLLREGEDLADTLSIYTITPDSLGVVFEGAVSYLKKTGG